MFQRLAYPPERFPKGDVQALVLAYALVPSDDPFERIKFGESELASINGNETTWTHIFEFNWNGNPSQTWLFDVCNRDFSFATFTFDVASYVKYGEKLTDTKRRDPFPSFTVKNADPTPILFKISAWNIPKKDNIFDESSIAAYSDPYVICYFRRGFKGADTRFATTSTINDVKQADWNDIVQFEDYRKGDNLYLKLVLKDADLGIDDDIGYVLIELDPFWVAGKPVLASVMDIETEKDTGATLTITPLVTHNSQKQVRPVIPPSKRKELPSKAKAISYPRSSVKG